MTDHKTFIDIGHEIGQLLEAKNLAYGNSFERSEEIIKILYPTGIPVEAYKDALAVVRIIDKLFRIANAKGAFGEDPWRDIAGYAMLSLWSAQHEDDPISQLFAQGREEAHAMMQPKGFLTSNPVMPAIDITGAVLAAGKSSDETPPL